MRSMSPEIHFLARTALLLLLILHFVLPIYAAPCYGTRMPGKKQVFWGVQNHTVFKRYLEDEYGKLRSTQDFLLLSYGAYDWLSIDLKGGAGNIKQHPVGSDEVDYSSSFNGGYGFRLRLYEDAKIKAVFGFQHISVHPRKARLGNIKNKAVLDDWQASLLGSYNWSRFTPYLGMKCSRMDYIHWQEEDRKRKMSDLTKCLGLVVGLDFDFTEEIWLNIEGQFFDNEALAIGANFRF